MITYLSKWFLFITSIHYANMSDPSYILFVDISAVDLWDNVVISLLAHFDHVFGGALF